MLCNVMQIWHAHGKNLLIFACDMYTCVPGYLSVKSDHLDVFRIVLCQIRIKQQQKHTTDRNTAVIKADGWYFGKLRSICSRFAWALHHPGHHRCVHRFEALKSMVWAVPATWQPKGSTVLRTSMCCNSTPIQTGLYYVFSHLQSLNKCV